MRHQNKTWTYLLGFAFGRKWTVLGLVLAVFGWYILRSAGPMPLLGGELGAARVLVGWLPLAGGIAVVFLPSKLLKLLALVMTGVLLVVVLWIVGFVGAWAENYRAGHGGTLSWIVDAMAYSRLPDRRTIETNQRKLLMEFFKAAGRSSWNQDTAGKGVIVDESGRVIALTVTGDDLDESLNGSYLCDLKHLQKVEITNTGLRGPIPTCLLDPQKLPKLRHLDLYGNLLRLNDDDEKLIRHYEDEKAFKWDHLNVLGNCFETGSSEEKTTGSSEKKWTFVVDEEEVVDAVTTYKMLRFIRPGVSLTMLVFTASSTELVVDAGSSSRESIAAGGDFLGLSNLEDLILIDTQTMCGVDWRGVRG